MNTNENISPEDRTVDQAQHEKLCAYVFGELQGDERVAFEAELAHSSELQRERARLEATIGLVKRAIPDEGLPEPIRRDLVAAARRSRFRVVHGRRLLQLAAAFAGLLGGAWAARSWLFQEERSPFTDSTFGEEHVARRTSVKEGMVERKFDGPSATPAPQKVAGTEQRADSLAENAPQQDSNTWSFWNEYQGQDKEQVASSLESGLAKQQVEPAEMELLDALGYSGGAPSAPTAQAETPTYAFGTTPDAGFFVSISPEAAAEESAPAGPAAPVAAATGEAVGHYGTGVPSAFVGRRAGGGHGRAARIAPPQEKSGELRALYRGPGDTLPPGDYGPELEERVRVFVADGEARARKEDKDENLAALEGLGYVGERDDQAELAQGVLPAAPAQEDSADAFFLGASHEKAARELDPELAARAERLLADCRILPGETPAAMFFRCWGDHPFVAASDDPLSTFAVDVDTASYTLARAYLMRDELPPEDAVRTEEFVNYFRADQPAPGGGDVFAIGLEAAPSLFNADPRVELLRVSVRGKDVESFQRQPLALTFVVDVSGSMNEGGRLELVKESIALLLRELGGLDTVALVSFAQEARVVSDMVAARNRGPLEIALEGMGPEGGTNVEAGLVKGYELAAANLARNAVNRVVLFSDGVGNIGQTKADEIAALVKENRAKGIYLNVFGVGMGNHDDAFLEQFADKGDGLCQYVDSLEEAQRALVDGLAKSFQPIARDVKIQVEFDPAQVESWRQLGYENRALRDEDFRKDEIDAGEVNAGHQVTALYEIVRVPRSAGPFATARVRYKLPFAVDRGDDGARAAAEAEQALEIARSIGGENVLGSFHASTGGYRRATLVAELAELLRNSVHARGDSLERLIEESKRLERELGDPEFGEFLGLVQRARPLIEARDARATPRLVQLTDELCRLHYEVGRRERARETVEPEVERSTREEIEHLENAVREELGRLHGQTLDPALLEALDELGYANDR